MGGLSKTKGIRINSGWDLKLFSANRLKKIKLIVFFTRRRGGQFEDRTVCPRGTLAPHVWTGYHKVGL